MTTHRLHRADARELGDVGPVQLVVTSPPYPMVEMWDDCFGSMDFESMHRELDRVWAECLRVLVPGGFLCINIGDAVRTVDGEFSLYPNHARILQACRALGFVSLPDILWRKPTNAPNKFMGSGMLPGGAYVTYEHEYVLILRKSGKREFDSELRRESAYFWEERNTWFSDMWSDIPGTRQTDGARRTAAFPFEIPWRLVHMYSLRGDTVLDPFVGTGTTMAAALAAGRSSVGFERNPEACRGIGELLASVSGLGATHSVGRLRDHRAFVAAREAAGRPLGYRNEFLDCAVMTRQEQALRLCRPVRVEEMEGGWRGEHGWIGG